MKFYHKHDVSHSVLKRNKNFYEYVYIVHEHVYMQVWEFPDFLLLL